MIVFIGLAIVWTAVLMLAIGGRIPDVPSLAELDEERSCSVCGRAM